MIEIPEGVIKDQPLERLTTVRTGGPAVVRAAIHRRRRC